MEETMLSVADKFKQHEKDTGSVEVQVANLTRDINKLQGHCSANPKDFGSRRGLLKMVGQRRSFLAYLKRENVELYKKLIFELDLRK